MKVISDSDISTYLLQNLSRASILDQFVPLLVAGLANFEHHPDAVPERTVRPSTTENSDTTHLFMPCVLPQTVGIKVISGGPSNSAKGLGFQGSVSLLDEYTGELKAVLNAKTLTAFRTALASCISLVKVFDPAQGNDNLTSVSVFGAGPQAFWHVILVTRLYPQITTVNIVSLSHESAEKLATELRKKVSPAIIAFSASDVPAEVVRKCSIIFGCTPSTEAIIKRNFVNGDPETTKFVSLIGSYKPHMIELDLGFIHEHYAGKSAKIIVDSKSHCLSEAGELIQGKIAEDQLVSLTEFYSNHEKSLDVVRNHSGVIVQKLVGLSVMDIVVAKYLGDHVEGHAVPGF